MIKKVKHSIGMILLGCGAWAICPEAAMAKTCEFAVKATDDIVFDVTDMKIAKDCSIIRLSFKHVGSVLKHNWVLVKKSELDRIRKDGEAAGEDTGFLPKSGKGIVAHSKLLEPGGADVIDIEVAKIKRGAPYVYFCSFPGHGATMKGTLRFVP